MWHDMTKAFVRTRQRPNTSKRIAGCNVLQRHKTTMMCECWVCAFYFRILRVSSVIIMFSVVMCCAVLCARPTLLCSVYQWPFEFSRVICAPCVQAAASIWDTLCSNTFCHAFGSTKLQWAYQMFCVGFRNRARIRIKTIKCNKTKRSTIKKTGETKTENKKQSLEYSILKRVHSAFWVHISIHAGKRI